MELCVFLIFLQHLIFLLPDRSLCLLCLVGWDYLYTLRDTAGNILYIPGILHIPVIHCSSTPKMSFAMMRQDSRAREGLDHYSLYKLSMWYWFISFITCANVVNGLTNISLKCLSFILFLLFIRFIRLLGSTSG